MAQSPAHRFGQIIGDLLEVAMIKYLRPIADQYGFYLDYKHPRSARNNKTEVIWKDINGNKHKLDIVFEDGGSEHKIGKPRVFIEMAWRRYTKHSKNKAQEIAGAIVPLISNYRDTSPFYGVVIAGEFTQPSITQLESQGFKVVYFKLDTIERAFNKVGINAHWEENTSEENIAKKIDQFEKLDELQIDAIINELCELNKNELEKFIKSLESSLERKIESIRIFSLHGLGIELNTAKEAYEYISIYDENKCNAKLVKYEILIRYNDGDKIEAQFTERQSALKFLMQYMD